MMLMIMCCYKKQELSYSSTFLTLLLKKVNIVMCISIIALINFSHQKWCNFLLHDGILQNTDMMESNISILIVKLMLTFWTEIFLFEKNAETPERFLMNRQFGMFCIHLKWRISTFTTFTWYYGKRTFSSESSEKHRCSEDSLNCKTQNMISTCKSFTWTTCLKYRSLARDEGLMNSYFSFMSYRWSKQSFQ